LVAAYLRAGGERLAYNSLRVHLAAVARYHRAAGISIDSKHPAIAAAVAEAKGRSAHAEHLAMPLVPRDLTRLLACLPEGAIGVRDRALLLAGYWLGASLSALVAVNCEDLVPRDDGILIGGASGANMSRHEQGPLLRSSFVAEVCPVLAIRRWLTMRGTAPGALFPRILKGGKITLTPLSSVYVTLMIKRLADIAGLPSGALSGRSLRTGVAGLTRFGPVSSRLRGVSDFFPQASYMPTREPSVSGAAWSSATGPISLDVSARWETRLGMLIDELSRLQTAVVSERMKYLGTTRIQYIALSEISRAGGLAQSDLARRLDLTNVGVSGLVSRLVAGGWAVRVVDRVDNRIKRVHLTDKARVLMRELQHIVEDVTAATFRHIAENDGYDLLRILGGMKIVLGALNGAAS
jgi:DNA-binding MarR family transcriptional regulator/site-specific recombinase XerC